MQGLAARQRIAHQLHGSSSSGSSMALQGLAAKQCTAQHLQCRSSEVALQGLAVNQRAALEQ